MFAWQTVWPAAACLTSNRRISRTGWAMYRQVGDPGGAAGDLEEGHEGAVEDAKLQLVLLPEERHPNHGVCTATARPRRDHGAATARSRRDHGVSGNDFS